MIKAKMLAVDVQGIMVQSNRDRGLLRAIGNALWERPLVRPSAETRSHLTDILDVTPDLVFTADKRGNLLYCNQAALELLGVEEGEHLGDHNLRDICSPSTRTCVLGEGIFAAILDGSWSGEANLVSRTGREIPVSLVIVAPLAADGRCEFFSVVARDITEKKRIESALKQRERFFRRLVEAADIGIGFIDPENRIGYANPKAARLLGYRADELIGERTASLVCEEENAGGSAPSDMAGREVEEARNVRLRRKDGAVVSAHVSTSPLFDEQDQPIGTLALLAEAEE